MLGYIAIPTRAESRFLQGEVEKTDQSKRRISRPEGEQGPQQTKGPVPANTSTRRFARITDNETEAPTISKSPVDLRSFKPEPGQPLSATAEFERVMQIPNQTFDLGADRGSQDLVLAWERWYKQFMRTIYYRTGRRTLPTGAVGFARARITVTKDHRLSAAITECSGSPLVAEGFEEALYSLNNNPGLTFPIGSQRETVTFAPFYKQSPFVRPGYDWIKDDYETVRQEY